MSAELSKINRFPLLPCEVLRLESDVADLNRRGLELQDQMEMAKEVIGQIEAERSLRFFNGTRSTEYATIQHWLVDARKKFNLMWEIYGEKMNLLLEARKRFPVQFFENPLHQTFRCTR